MDATRKTSKTSAASIQSVVPSLTASEAASDTFVPERFTPPSGLPPGTTCEYLPPWLEAAMNSMVAKAVQLVTRYPTLSHLPIDAKVRVGLIDYDVRNITIGDLSLSQIRMGDADGRQGWGAMALWAGKNGCLVGEGG